MTINKNKQTMYGGAIVLIFGGILVKIIGALFKIPLQNLIGDVGSAYFSVAYDIYTWMYIITTAGLPVAISRIVAEKNAVGEPGDGRRTLSLSFKVFILFGAACTLFMFFGAEWLTGEHVLNSPNAKYAVMAIAPAIVFEVVMSCYRGYNQGLQNMIPTAISQIIVAVIKLVAGMGIATYLSGYFEGNPLREAYVAAGAIFGVTLGCFLGAVYLAISTRRTLARGRTDKKPVTSNGALLKRLIAIAVPVTIGASVLSVTNLVDTAMLFRRLLAAGFDQAATDSMYGYYGWARTLFNLPTALIVPLGVAVVPAISELFTLKKLGEAKATLESTLRVSAIMSIPCGLGLAALSEPILLLLYPMQAESAVKAAPLLTMLGPAVVFVCLVSITNSILQAMGKERVPIFTMLIGGALKIVCNYYLVGTPEINISGAPIGTNLCYGVITLLNLIVIAKALGGQVKYGEVFVKPLISSAVSCGAAWGVYRLIGARVSNLVAVAATILIAGILHVALLFVLRAIKREDVQLLPKGKKIEKILDKYRLLG